MPQEKYSALPKAEKRQLLDGLDGMGMIDKIGKPRLGLRYFQLEFKVPKHRASHNIKINREKV